MEENNEQKSFGLKPGDKYLSIRLSAKTALSEFTKAVMRGEDSVEFQVWPNSNRNNENSPDFRCEGVAVWVNIKGVKKAVNESGVKLPSESVVQTIDVVEEVTGVDVTKL